MTRRRVLGLLGAALPVSAAAYQAARPMAPTGLEEIASGPFVGTRQSLSAYEIPEWFRDAKFGIWAHWGPQSAVEAGDWYARNMYMEGSPQYNYHCETYGHPSKFGFKDTIPNWKAERFDPAELMKLYKKAGAKYFMSMGVHHDNFDLWNSKHQHWNAAQMGPKKDIVGLWRKAAMDEGLKFGVSEHLWITYKWFSTSHGHDALGPDVGVAYDGADPKNFDLYVDSDEVQTKLDWNESNIPEWWKRHWYARMRDLLDNYQPDLLYTDGALPFEEIGLSLVAHHYNANAKRHGGKTEAVYTSKRLQDTEKGIATYDVERGLVDQIWPRPWQTDTCIGDWHYKRGVKYKSPKTVIDLLVDIVSRNGNLMLNFPLPARGELDIEERNVLTGITEWMGVNAEAIHGTRPWKIFGESPAVVETPAQAASFNEKQRKDLSTADIRFTKKGDTLYAFVMGWPEYQAVIHPLASHSALRVGKIQNVELLGFDGKLEWSQDDSGLKVLTPAKKPCDHAVVFKVTGA
ncbi:MAG TPA: alpha-L-fucosidase [Bryobacteraceae bacterium]